MDCPECKEPFSIITSTMHGDRVHRKRHCVGCKQEWPTVEITRVEFRELFDAMKIAVETQRQVARLWKENGA